jgi:hypothetical protein
MTAALRDGSRPADSLRLLGGGSDTASFWAVLFPLIPWATAVTPIYATPNEGDVGRGGATILWSFVFASLAGFVIAGVLSARRLIVGVARKGSFPPQRTSRSQPPTLR